MIGFFKKLLGLVLVVVLLCSGGVAVFVYTFNPNDYKEEISEYVAGETGRALTMSGDIELSLWPDIGLDLGGVALADARGFGGKPFLAVEQAKLVVRLLPLLSGEVRVAGVALKGAHLKLVQNRNGVNNWDDLMKSPRANQRTGREKPASGKGAAGGVLLLAALGQIEMEDVSVAWKDDRNNDSWNVRMRRFETGVWSDFETRLQLKDLAAVFDVNGSMGGVTDGMNLRGVTLRSTRLSMELGGDRTAMQSLDGDIALELEDGRFRSARGGAFLTTLENVAAFLQGRPPAVSDDALVIESVRATLTLERSVGRNDDLAAELPLFDVTGEGQLDFAREYADYTLHLKLKGTDQRIPVRVTGHFDNLEYDVSMPGFVEKIRELGEKAGEKIKKGLERAPEKAQKLLDKTIENLKLPF